MQLTFKIHYETQWGQQLIILGSVPELGNQQLTDAFRLQYLGDGFWGGTIPVADSYSKIAYQYVLVDDFNTVLGKEWGTVRLLDLAKVKTPELIVKDNWKGTGHPEHALYTSAFQNLIFKPAFFKPKKSTLKANESCLQFRIQVPRITETQQVCILGNIATLGHWDPERAILLSNDKEGNWTIPIPLPEHTTIEYKYGIFDTEKKTLLYLEEGANRKLELSSLRPGVKTVQLNDNYLRHPIGDWKGTGIALPVFALRTSQGLGVGQFTDLKALIDWAKAVDMRMVQILPINDTTATKTWVDSYPYAAISVFALHPLYLDITKLEGFKKRIDQQVFEQERAQLNALEVVDYEKVLALKLDYAHRLFEAEQNTFLKSTAFQQYLKNNQKWLKPYALFCYFRDTYGTADFTEWKKDATFSNTSLTRLTDPKAETFDAIAFYYYLQYNLHLQLKEVAEYARANGIVLKGDIPIGIYRYSVDAWTEPQLYNMNGQAGAPPDPFSELGQNWGFPTYNWDEMAKDGFLWWQNRFKQLSYYFDAFRIDHILGFFRIWQIPIEQVQGLLGYFNPAIPIDIKEFWPRGIPFDQERFCKPFITDALLREEFPNAEDLEYVKNTFFDSYTEGKYSFKATLNTQRSIQNFLADKKDKAHLLSPLFTLVANFLFMEAETGEETFHPRIDFQNTSSFRALDWETQNRLSKLYIDYFYGRQEEFWKEQAMAKLPAIKKATNMLICGEDLGMVPDSVPGVMRELEFLTLEIQRMSKKPESEFLQAIDVPYFSVASPSTHDMSPIRAWWEESAWSQIQRFYNQELGRDGICPPSCEPEIVTQIIAQHLYWPAMWAVFPIQDLLGMDKDLRCEDPSKERINEPSNPQHYWRYRMHLTLDELQKAEAFNQKLKTMIQDAGRG